MPQAARAVAWTSRKVGQMEKAIPFTRSRVFIGGALARLPRGCLTVRWRFGGAQCLGAGPQVPGLLLAQVFVHGVLVRAVRGSCMRLWRGSLGFANVGAAVQGQRVRCYLGNS